MFTNDTVPSLELQGTARWIRSHPVLPSMHSNYLVFVLWTEKQAQEGDVASLGGRAGRQVAALGLQPTVSPLAGAQLSLVGTSVGQVHCEPWADRANAVPFTWSSWARSDKSSHDTKDRCWVGAWQGSQVP